MGREDRAQNPDRPWKRASESFGDALPTVKKNAGKSGFGDRNLVYSCGFNIPQEAIWYKKIYYSKDHLSYTI